jgi:F-type H+-transporting ATPase subunit delta
MKMSAKKYALGLYEAIKDKNEGEIKQIIKEFAGILFKNKDLKIAEEIIKDFIKICDEHDGVVNAKIVSAEKLDSSMIKLLENYIEEMVLAKKVNIIEETDEGILGGVVITYGDKVLDGSLRTKLQELKKTMVK